MLTYTLIKDVIETKQTKVLQLFLSYKYCTRT